ncbi:MAG: hypothetical protein V3T84_02105 [Phycisphaerales bacterium]
MNSEYSSIRPLARVLVLAVGTLLAGCATVRSQPKQPANLRTMEQRVESSRRIGQQRAEELKQMSVAELDADLEADSQRGREPFNSLAYKEVVGRGENAGPDLFRVIQAADRSEHLSLLALREVDRERYDALDAGLRSAILLDALSSSLAFNVWGIPHLYWEASADSLIAERAAVPGLVQLLGDKRPAPVWGDEEATIARMYNYRVCDYAWAMLQAMRGEIHRANVPRDVPSRDRLIEEELARH